MVAVVELDVVDNGEPFDSDGVDRLRLSAIATLWRYVVVVVGDWRLYA